MPTVTRCLRRREPLLDHGAFHMQNMSAGVGVSIGVSVLSRRHPRLLFWILIGSVAAFVPLAIWVTAGTIQQFEDSRSYAASRECASEACYQNQTATVVRTTIRPDGYTSSREAIVTLQLAGTQADVRLDDKNAWSNAHVNAGETVQALVWRGRVIQVARGGATFRSVDFPSFDWSNVLVLVLAWTVTAIFAYMAFQTRRLVKQRETPMSQWSAAG